MTLGRILRFLCGLAALVIAFSAFAKQNAGVFSDLRAYHTVGTRVLAGEPIYQSADKLPYKYAPITAYCFVPLALLPYDVLRWLWCVFHLSLMFLGPWLALKIVRKAIPPDEISDEVLYGGLLLAFVGLLRVIDNEFSVSQIGTLLSVTLLASAYLVTRGYRAGVFLYGLAAVVKVYGLMAFAAFDVWRDRRTLVMVACAIAFVVLLPDPRLWGAWYMQMKSTTPLITEAGFPPILQGWVPAIVYWFGVPPLSSLPLLAGIPAIAAIYFFTPRFSLKAFTERPLDACRVVALWVFTGVLFSPLPWQHSYAALWPLFLLFWIPGTRNERIALAVAMVFSGLTPKGILGGNVATWLETRQSFFFAMAAVWFVFFVSIRRRARAVT